MPEVIRHRFFWGGGEGLFHVGNFTEAVCLGLAWLAEPNDYQNPAYNGYEADEVPAAGATGVVEPAPTKTERGEQESKRYNSVEHIV